jgi:hypothetical protein
MSEGQGSDNLLSAKDIIQTDINGQPSSGDKRSAFTPSGQTPQPYLPTDMPKFKPAQMEFNTPNIAKPNDKTQMLNLKDLQAPTTEANSNSTSFIGRIKHKLGL